MANERNPIEYSEFIKPDDSITNLIKQLEDTQKAYSDTQALLRTEAKKTEDAVNKASVATEGGRDEMKKAAAEADRLAKANEKLNQSRAEGAVEIAKLKEQQRIQNNQNKLTAKLNAAAEGSYDKLSAQYSLNKIKLNAMSAAEREASREGQELEASTAALMEEMKRLQEATGKHSLSVGDYEKGWRGLKEEMNEVPGAAGEAADGLDTISDAAKALLANPLVLFIAAIVAGLSALFSLFTKTSRSAELFAKAGAYLEGTLSALVGFTDKLVTALIDAFENPQKAIKDFGAAVYNNIINRFIGLYDLITGVGSALISLLSADFDEFKKQLADTGDAMTQIVTGLTPEQVAKVAGAFSEMTAEIERQASAFVKLHNAQEKTRDIHRSLERTLERLTTELALAQVAADDSTTSFKAQKEAAETVGKVLLEKARIEKRIAADNLKLITKELDLRAANGEMVEDLVDAQLEAYKVLAGAERDFLVASAEGSVKASQLKQDLLEKDLDIFIDGYANQQAINEAIIKDQSRPIEERRKLLAETQALEKESFDKQIETIQKFTGVNVKANELVTESNAVALQQKIRALGVSEIIEGRTLEIVRDKKSNAQALADLEKDLAKEAEETAKKEYDAKLKSFEGDKKLAESEIDLLKITEAEKTKLKLEAERDRLKKIKALNEQAGGELSAQQLKILDNQIEALTNKINTTAKEDIDIYSAVGLSLTDDKKQVIEDSTAFAVEQVNEFTQAKVNSATEAVSAAENETEAAQTALDAEIENRAAGYASNVEGAKKELALAKKTQDKALAEQAKAQKIQNRLNTISQVGNLVTASAKIWKDLGFPWAIPAIALMFGSFAASKAKANKTAKTYGKGGLEFLNGGSHASGNDINIGRTADGRDRRAEGGEAMAIINKSNTAKYKHILPDVIEALNLGTFEERFGGVAEVNVHTDNSGIEKGVELLRKQGEKRSYRDAQGRYTETYKNLKRVHR